MTRSLLLTLTLVACGPTTAVDDAGDSGDGSTSGSVTGVFTVTDTTVTTTSASTSTATTVSTTMPGDGDTTNGSNSEGESDGGSEISEGGSFVQEPDGGGCFALCIECDIWSQDCVEGEKCMPWGNNGGDVWNASKCTPVDRAPAAIGEPCVVEGSGVSGIDDCGLGAMCWGVDPITLEGVCVDFCIGSEANPVCGDGFSCFMGFEGYIHVCLPTCDPLGSECAPDEACAQYFFQGGFDTDSPFVCLPIPPFVAQPYGAPCGVLEVCDVGLVCVDEANFADCDQLGCCTTLGDLAMPPVCPDATHTCLPFEEGATEGPCYCGVP